MRPVSYNHIIDLVSTISNGRTLPCVNQNCYSGFTMNNCLFTQNELRILTDIRQWKLVYPPDMADVAPVSDYDHEQWMLQNTHNHPYKEILFVLDGGGVFGCAGSVYPACPGTVFIMNSYIEHDLYYPDNVPAFQHMWLFAFQDRCIYQRVSGTGRNVDKIQVLAHEDNSQGAALLYEESLSDDIFRLQTALSSLIYTVVRGGYENPEPAAQGSFQDQVIDAICRHIQDTAGRGSTLETLARISGYSKFHFLRLFKQHTGMSVHEYIDTCRHRRVRQMEAEGRYKKEIAAELGFSCLAAYSRWAKTSSA